MNSKTAFAKVGEIVVLIHDTIAFALHFEARTKFVVVATSNGNNRHSAILRVAGIKMSPRITVPWDDLMPEA